jgi:gag-polypeptide of LTR copia-type
MSSSNDHSPPQLTINNYHQWSRDMLMFLNRHGLGLIISQDWTKPTLPESPTAADRNEVLAFKQAQSKAAGYLYAAVAKDQKVHLDDIADMNDAVAIWNKLKKTYVQQNSTTRFTALDTLLRAELKEGESLVDLAARVTRLRNEFKQLLPDGYKLEQLLEDLEVNALLNALPSDHYPTLSQALWLESSLTCQIVHDKFLAHTGNKFDSFDAKESIKNHY